MPPYSERKRPPVMPEYSSGSSSTPMVPQTVQAMEASSASGFETMDVEGSQGSHLQDISHNYPSNYPAMPASSYDCDISRVENQIEIGSQGNASPLTAHIEFNKGRIETSGGLFDMMPAKDRELVLGILKKTVTKGQGSDDASSTQSGPSTMTDVEFHRFLSMDVEKIPVKKLRIIIPRLRMLGYFSQAEIAGKRKMKHLWDEKPQDWPNHVKFIDPNNGEKGSSLNGGKVLKPGKTDLTKMFNFLRDRYYSKYPRNPHVVQPSEESLPSPQAETITEPTTPLSIQVQEEDLVLQHEFNNFSEKTEKMILLVQTETDIMFRLQKCYDVVKKLYEKNGRNSDFSYEFINAAHEMDSIYTKMRLTSKRMDKRALCIALDEFVEKYNNQLMQRGRAPEDHQYTTAMNQQQQAMQCYRVENASTKDPMNEIYADNFMDSLLNSHIKLEEVDGDAVKSEIMSNRNNPLSFEDLGIKPVGNGEENIDEVINSQVFSGRQEPLITNIKEEKEDAGYNEDKIHKALMANGIDLSQFAEIGETSVQPKKEQNFGYQDSQNEQMLNDNPMWGSCYGILDQKTPKGILDDVLELESTYNFQTATTFGNVSQYAQMQPQSVEPQVNYSFSPQYPSSARIGTYGALSTPHQATSTTINREDLGSMDMDTE